MTTQDDRPTTKIAELIARQHLDSERVSVLQFCEITDAIDKALRDRDERAAKIADDVENEWLENARNVVRADDLVGGLAQTTYTNYAEVAGKIASAIRGKS